jgi:hypothetical protein
VEISNSVIVICSYDQLPIQTPSIVTNIYDNMNITFLKFSFQDCTENAVQTEKGSTSSLGTLNAVV